MPHQIAVEQLKPTNRCNAMFVMLVLQPPTELQPLHVVVLDFVSGLPHRTAPQSTNGRVLKVRLSTAAQARGSSSSIRIRRRDGRALL